MSTNVEFGLSQGALTPTAEIAVPNTPPCRILSPSPDIKPLRENDVVQLDKTKDAGFCSPPPVSSSEITPPPSTQGHASLRRRERSESPAVLNSPSESMEKTLYAAYGASENLPTIEEIDAAHEEQLRIIAKELLSVAQEARMSSLHFKLQNSLMSFASNEAIKRAEVEQQLVRREVEILRSVEYRNRQNATVLRTPQLSPSPPLDASLKRIEELENENSKLHRRLRSAKKLILDEAGKHETLKDEIKILKDRIRQNREHFSQILDHGSLTSIPRTEFYTPQRKTQLRYPDSARSQVSRCGSHDAFATLLAADRVLSGEPPVSPPNSRHKITHGGHMRSSHSLSSLPVTPQRPRTAYESHYLTPGSRRPDGRLSTHSARESRVERDRHDRDSTISVSDAEEAVTDEDVPASQASSLATSMLRRYPGSSQEESSVPSQTGKSSALLQTKLFGLVKKAGVDCKSESLKHKAETHDNALAAKKAKLADRVGLGIESWANL